MTEMILLSEAQMARISSSERLRLVLQVAWTPPWLETTGRLAMASTSAIKLRGMMARSSTSNGTP